MKFKVEYIGGGSIPHAGLEGLTVPCTRTAKLYMNTYDNVLF
jgi:hypothetical protein